jgi:hypothetical protein
MGAATAPRTAPAALKRRQRPRTAKPARRTPPAKSSQRGAHAATSQRSAPASSGKRTARAATSRRTSQATRRKAQAPKARQARTLRPGFAQPALAGAALIPHAAVRSVAAVRDLSDSSLIIRLTRGRGWIAVLCALLVGIVTLNVISLSLNAGSGRVGLQISELERANSTLRAELAEKMSASRIGQLAPGAGYYAPDPEDVGYLTARDADLERLLKLFSNEMVLGRGGGVDPAPSSGYYPETAIVPAPTAPVTSAPAPTASTPTAPGVSAPAAPAPAAPAPAPSPAPSPSTGATGGVGL